MTRDIMGGLVFAAAAIVVYLACSVNPVTGDGNGNPSGPTCQNPSDAATLADFNVTPTNGTRTVTNNSFESGPKRGARAQFKLKTLGLFTPMDLDLRFSNVRKIRVRLLSRGKDVTHRTRSEIYDVTSLNYFSVPMDTAADPINRMVVKAVPQNRKEVVGLQVDKFTACKIQATPTTPASLPSETTASTSLPLELSTEPLPMPECDDSQFMCWSGRCVDEGQVCDGYYDCDDASDEIGCICDSDGFRCKNEECVDPSVGCDDNVDCEDGSDEAYCGCPSFMFKCWNGDCIYMTAVCDGIVNCADQSDEMFCLCDSNDFGCKNEECTDLSIECDGNVDCEDGSDEEYCAS